MEKPRPSARDIANKITEPIAVGLHEHFPKLSPNDITLLGLIGTSAALILNYIAQKNQNNKLKTVAGAGYFVFSLTDTVDGPLARHINKQGGRHNTQKGQLVDVGTDRLAESLAAIARIHYAKKNQQPLGIIAAGLAGMTNFLPSYFRALAEAQGKEVPESGKDFLGFLGTRAGRLVTTMVGNFSPSIKGQKVQPILDLLTALANLKTAKERVETVQNKEIPSTLPPEKIKAAKKRQEMLRIFSILGISTVGLFTALSWKNKK